jgi:esterase/lipase superfamily enzyme
MVSFAERRLRSLPRAAFILTALLGCGLLASACSEAPKLAKVPTSHPTTTSEEKASPPPEAPEAYKSDEDARRKAAEAEEAERVRELSRQESAAKQKYSRRYEAEPKAGAELGAPDTNQPSYDAQGVGGGGSSEAPPDESRAAGESASPMQPEMPSGGAAPPSDMMPSPPPSPPASVGQGAPAPTMELPPVAEAPPPPPAAEPPAMKPGAAAPSLPSPQPSLPPPVASPAPPPPAASRAAPIPDPSKTYDVVPVFYGTDRAVEPDPKRLQFGSERGHILQLGRALITVPLSHKVPHIERPWLIEIPYFKVKIYEEKEDPAKHFTVQEISSLTEDQMLALVKERLAQSSTFKDHAFVFVHGFNTSFDCALYRTAQIAYDLKFDGVPFVYSWPSGGKVASYTYDHGSVEQAEPTLAEFLNLVIQKSGAKSISLIAHSMGNELLLRVLERLKPKIPPGVVISQVILAAPDVDRDKFNIIAREITDFAKGVTLYAASNDRALGYSARFWGGVPRAGDVPITGPLIIPGVDTIDVTAVSTDALGLNHSGYAENPALLDDVRALVEFGLRPPDKRIKNVLTVQSSAGTFWRFQAAP